MARSRTNDQTFHKSAPPTAQLSRLDEDKFFEKKKEKPSRSFLFHKMVSRNENQTQKNVHLHPLAFSKTKKSTGIRNFSRKKLTGQEDEANHFITAQKSQPCNLVIHYSLKA